MLNKGMIGVLQHGELQYGSRDKIILLLLRQYLRESDQVQRIRGQKKWQVVWQRIRAPYGMKRSP